MKLPSGFRIALLPMLVLIPASRAAAQSAQIGAFAGYQFGGALTSSFSGTNYNLGSGLDWGGTLDVAINKTWRFEALYSRQDTEIKTGSASFNPGVRVERYMVGFEEEQHPNEKVRPYGVILLGASRFVPKDTLYEPDTHFSAMLGLGVKCYATEHVGFHLGGRLSYTLVPSGGGAICSNGTCLFAFTGSGLWQGDVNGGLFLSF